MNPLIILAAPFCGAFISYFIGQKKESLRDLFDILLTAGVLISILTLAPALKWGPIVRHVPQLMGTGLDLSIGPLQYLMMLLTASIWFLTTMFLIQYVPTRKKRNRFHFFFLLTYASTLGFFMTDNILNQFTFFEVLSLSAYFLIIHDEDDEAHKAGTLYLTMAILGGLSALLGILIAYEAAGTLNIGEIGRVLAPMRTERSIAGGLLFFGYAIKAGIFPLHIWLPKAYAAAPTPATAVLTGILAKTGLYGLFTTVVIITGSDPVFAMLAMVLGTVTLFHGGILALMQRNIKRILAYSSMSQYGLILLGIGLGAQLGFEGTTALTGAFIHMISHSLFKVLLFLSIGLLYLKTQDLNLNLIHGIGRRSPLLAATVCLGVFSAWGIPGFSGSVSKSLLHEGLSQWAHGLPTWGGMAAEALFLLGSGLTVAYLLKLITALMVDPPSEFSEMIWLKRQKRAAVPMAILCILIMAAGLFPNTLLEIAGSGLVAAGFTQAAESAHGTGSPLAAVPPLLIGIAIHFLITRRFLRTDLGKEISYANPSLLWFSLETQLYAPAGLGLFRRMTALVAIADSGLTKAGAALSTLLQAADRLLIPSASAQDPFAPPEADESDSLPDTIPDTLPDTPTILKTTPQPVSTKAPLKVPVDLQALLEGASGLTFALYLFGAFLVSLIFMLLFR